MRNLALYPNSGRLLANLLLCVVLTASASGQGMDSASGVLTQESPHPSAEYDRGPIPLETPLVGIALHFRRTPAQEADLQSLLIAQQDPNSPRYHQWLTPEEFAARFGLPESELEVVESWLLRQGFVIDSVARGKTMLRFSGTAAQINAAFAMELHAYAIPGSTGVEAHFAPSSVPIIPAVLIGFVQAISNLDDFRPRLHLRSASYPRPEFSGYDQTIFFSPADIAVQYDVLPAYAAGFDGAGQSIAVVGQSLITLSDIESFQTAANLPVKDPNLILIPNTGVPIHSQGDETESDLDLEWAGAIARGATLTLVYTGSANNLGAFDAVEYAIDNRIANLISISYGTCETALAGFSLETFFAQAAAQGQTVVAASGDAGSTDCFRNSRLTVQQQQALAVDYPASSPNVTGVGGTEISQANPAYETQGGVYWEKSNGSSDIPASLTQPVPEQAWNEDKTCASFAIQGGDPICSGGGGVSTLFARPMWQTGVSGIPSGGQRDVPDVSLAASIYNPGYLLCTSDQSAWQQNQVGSCSSGFRDAVTGDLTAAGGTSFAAPIFAGMMAIVNQRQGYVAGSGLANPNLYKLAAAAATYASAFHDIVTGGNQCDAAQPTALELSDLPQRQVMTWPPDWAQSTSSILRPRGRPAPRPRSLPPSQTSPPQVKCRRRTPLTPSLSSSVQSLEPPSPPAPSPFPSTPARRSPTILSPQAGVSLTPHPSHRKARTRSSSPIREMQLMRPLSARPPYRSLLLRRASRAFRSAPATALSIPGALALPPLPSHRPTATSAPSISLFRPETMSHSRISVSSLRTAQGTWVVSPSPAHALSRLSLNSLISPRSATRRHSSVRLAAARRTHASQKIQECPQRLWQVCF